MKPNAKPPCPAYAPPEVKAVWDSWTRAMQEFWTREYPPKSKPGKSNVVMFPGRR